MHPFEVLSDPVRRAILDRLATREHAAGELVEVVGGAFGISQPAVSKQLRVLRDNGFATVRIDGPRRIYALDTPGIDSVESWLATVRAYWTPKLDALATEVARARRERRRNPTGTQEQKTA